MEAEVSEKFDLRDLGGRSSVVIKSHGTLNIAFHRPSRYPPPNARILSRLG